MKAPIETWGRRLSDAVRAALVAGELELALRLAIDGDGQVRSLAKEYSFMIRGLAITLRVLAPLLENAAARGGAEESATAAAELAVLLRGFRSDLLKASNASGLAQAGSMQPVSLAQESVRFLRTLEAIETWFDADQSRRAQEIARAIEAGDGARALALIDAKEQGAYLPLHDRIIRFMADSFAWVLRRYGSDQLLQLHLDSAEGQRAGFEKWEAMSAAEFAWITAFLLKQHMGQVTVLEDDKRFTIEQRPCGSGGRLQLAGAYAGSDGLPFVETPGALTFGGPRTPVYCSHCAIWNGLATLRWFGRAHWVFESPARADGGCTLHIYKRPEDEPALYRERLGHRREV